VARRAARQHGRALDVVLLHQLSPQRDLLAGGLPAHVENLFSRSQELLWLAMATQAPFHLQRVFLAHQRHTIHGPMASVTTHAFLNMNRMVEVCEIGKVVDAGPANRRAVLKTISHRPEDVACGPNLGVTVHANRRRGDTGKRGRLNRRMTVAAIDAEPGHMVFVAERHGLLSRHILIGDVRRAIDRGD